MNRTGTEGEKEGKEKIRDKTIPILSNNTLTQRKKT
jgi:hypothetical protein